MKKYLLPAVVLATAFFFLVWLKPEHVKSELALARISSPQTSRAMAFGISQELRGMPAAKAATGEAKVREIGNPLTSRQNNNFAHDADAAVAEVSSVPMPAPITNFNGLTNINNGEI